MPINLAESTPLAISEAGPGDNAQSWRFRVLLIRAGWGASGYYSESLLKTDGPRCWPAGTQNYLDHPTESEQREKPERSVKDYASVIVTDPVWDPIEKGLAAEVEVFPQWRGLLNKEFAEKIGLSIRACGVAEYGEAEGRQGQIITELTEGISVDWVTKAGAGGKVLQLIESARNAPPATEQQLAEAAVKLAEARNVAQWLESRIHLMFTQIADDLYGDGRLTRDERIALSSAIGDGLAAFTKRVEADQPQLYTRDRWDGPPEGDADLSEADKATPENPGDITTVTENEPGTQPADDKKEGIVPELTEDQKRQLAEAATLRADLEAANALLAEASAAQTELDQTRQQLAEATAKVAETAAVADRVTELETRLAESAARNQRLENDQTARAQVAEALKTSGLPEFAHSRVTESVCRDLPTTDGVLDTAKLTEAITAAIDGEKAYVASVAEATGAGSVRGLGGAPAPKEMTEADFDAELKESFIGIGMSPEAAQRAALGR